MRHNRIFLAVLAITALASVSSVSIVAPLTVVSGPSPFAGCTVGGTSTSVLYVNAEVEPWIEVNPTNPNNVIAVWQQDRWSDGGALGLVTGVSHNAGQTWSRTWPHFSICAGGTAANGGDYERATDPWVTFAPNGDAYQISLSFDSTRSTANAILVSKSTDGGDTWGEPVTVIRDTDPRFFNDKESITADPTDSSYVYAVWDRTSVPPGVLINPEHVFGLGFKGPVYFSRTTDASQTWEPARLIYDPGANNSTLGNQIVVLPNGTILNFFTEFLNFKNNDKGSQFDANLSVLRSTDKGASWNKVRRVAKQFFQGALDPDTGRPIRAEGAIADLAVDRVTGNLYAVWQDLRFRGVDEVAFMMSADGGHTWSTPIRLNQTPANAANALNQQAFLPSVHVADNGTVAVTYYDFRNNDANPGAPTDYWIVHCHAACSNAANWGAEARLSSTSFDIEQAPAARGPFGFFIGDYEGLTNIGDIFLPLFVQVNNGNAANRTDVFFTIVSQ